MVTLRSGLEHPSRTDPDGYSHTMASERISSLTDVRAYISQMDFSMMKHNMEDRAGGLEWAPPKCEWAERQYKRWLYIRREYENEPMPPNREIDKFWHEHMLDTRRYFVDSAKIFGYYHHHFPYFGTRGEADAEDLRRAWKNTCRRFRETFGIYPLEFEDLDHS